MNSQEISQLENNQSYQRITVPDDLAKIFDAYVACHNMRNDWVKMPFVGYKMAQRAALEAEQHRLKFWREIKKVYPDIQTESFTYDHLNKKLFWKPLKRKKK